MTANQFSKKYAALTPAQQITFLARLAASIATNARQTYQAETDSVAEPERLREFNEFVHRVTVQLMSMLSGSLKRYPDTVFASIVWDFSDSLGVCDALVTTLKGVAERATKRHASVA